MSEKPEKVPMNIRLGRPGVDWLDALAAEEGSIHPSRDLNRTDVVRVCLVVARHHEQEVRALLRAQV